MVRTGMLLLALLLVLAACGSDDDGVGDGDYDVADQPDDAAAAFVSPGDGETLGTSVEVVMSAEAVDIVAAGPAAVGEAHFHVLVDVGCLAEGDIFPGPSPEDEAEGYFHFGDGSTEGTLALNPGTYQLCLQLGDGIHQAFGATETISITVE